MAALLLLGRDGRREPHEHNQRSKYASEHAAASASAVRKVIFASSLGTVFEWYDFYIYATLAPFFAALFFPPGNATAALLASFATYAAGFLVRPFGALVFGRIGDLVGRKYTFLVTIMVMGLATAAVGLLPTYASVGMLSPTILVLLRLAQGLALGGEYGGAATYVAEHAPDSKRGLHTSWIQTTATLGFFLSLVIIGGCRLGMAEPAFKQWGWRIPFLISLVLLVDLGLHPAQAERVAGVPRDEEPGQGEQGAAEGRLRQLVEPQDRAAGAVRRGGRAGRRLVHGAVLRAVLPDRDAEDRVEDGLRDHRRLAGAGDGPVRLLRLAVRQDRSQEDHDGRLPAGRAHLLPDLSGDDPLREPGAGDVRGQHEGVADRRQLPDAPVPEPQDRLQRVRQGSGLPVQAQLVVRDDAGCGRGEGRDAHQRRR